MIRLRATLIVAGLVFAGGAVSGCSTTEIRQTPTVSARPALPNGGAPTIWGKAREDGQTFFDDKGINWRDDEDCYVTVRTWSSPDAKQSETRYRVRCDYWRKAKIGDRFDRSAVEPEKAPVRVTAGQPRKRG